MRSNRNSVSRSPSQKQMCGKPSLFTTNNPYANLVWNSIRTFNSVIVFYSVAAKPSQLFSIRFCLFKKTLSEERISSLSCRGIKYRQLECYYALEYVFVLANFTVKCTDVKMLIKCIIQIYFKTFQRSARKFRIESIFGFTRTWLRSWEVTQKLTIIHKNNFIFRRFAFPIHYFQNCSSGFKQR